VNKVADLRPKLIRSFLFCFSGFTVLFLLMTILSPLFAGSLKLTRPGGEWRHVVFLGLLTMIVMLVFLSLRGASYSAMSTRILIVLIAAFEAVILIAFKDILPPEIDGGHVYTKAIDLLRGSGRMQNNLYFQLYPNNVPVTVLRYLLYRMLPFGNEPMLLLLDRLLCALCLNLAIFFSWKFVRLTLGPLDANLLLVFVLGCLPLFFYLPYFYSDTLALMFPPLLLYMVARYHREGGYLRLLMLIVILSLGCVLRPNLILFLPAMAIYLLLQTGGFRKVVLVLLLSAILLPGAHLPIQFCADSLGIHTDNHLKLPAMHWIVLGLSESGRYHSEELGRMLRLPTRESRQAVALTEVKNRLKANGPYGLAHLWIVKAFRTYADGSMGYYWYASVVPRKSMPYDVVFGNEKAAVLLMIQVFHACCLFFLCVSPSRFFRIRRMDEYLLVQVMLFGNFLFYIFLWEAEPRYALLFVFPMMIGAVSGLKETYLWIQQFRFVGKMGKPPMLKWIKWSLCAVLLAAGLSTLPAGDASDHKRIVAGQSRQKGRQEAVVRVGHDIQQTFRASETFNRVALRVVHHVNGGMYVLTVAEEHTGKILIRNYFSGNRLEQEEWIHLALPKAIAPGEAVYRLSIRHVGGSAKAALKLATHGRGLFELRDIYPGGNLYLDHRRQAGKDLTFQVYRVERRFAAGFSAYGLLIGVPILMIWIGLRRWDISPSVEDNR
jgi:hypothetical protein